MSDKCNVTVDSNGIVSVSDQNLKPNGNNVTLEWKMNSPGWEFATDGIVIANNNGQFTNPQLTNNGQKFTVVDANNNTLLYTYTVNVQRTGNPGMRRSIDPTIQNGGGK